MLRAVALQTAAAAACFPQGTYARVMSLRNIIVMSVRVPAAALAQSCRSSKTTRASTTTLARAMVVASGLATIAGLVASTISPLYTGSPSNAQAAHRL